ncbi:ubiquitin carboxyl-terminal hydrolase 2 [Ananas comosus]|uniref:Ubiquitin carboxyl-terminal hydrolase 2 n=1 Tax=Ananas comosus TaxID=4615 RepID=A0A6P5F6C9_ANACO|nr:ubiquitin carboxyl-terminal hydrolase 2 [Ananas comosus]
MGKRVKPKARNPRKAQPQAAGRSAQAISEPKDPKSEVGDEEVKEKEQCNHFTKDSSHLNQVLLGMLSSKDVAACEHCREEPSGSRRGNKEKGKQSKKKGGGGGKYSEAKSESQFIWVCLDCGRSFCGGTASASEPYGHARRHAKQERHSWAVRSDSPSIAWCFPCDSEIPIEIPEEEIPKLTVVDKALEPGADTLKLSNSKGYVIRGLSNLGNTCFFNSVLQNLLAIDKLREYMVNLDWTIGPLTMALKKLFIETSSVDDSNSKAVLSPKNLFGGICAKAPQFRGYQQQDSHELLRYLLDGLFMEETSARKSPESSVEQEQKNVSILESTTMVDFFFGGQLSSTIACKECGHTSVIHEPFLDLSLPVPSKKPPAKKPPPPPPRKSKPPLRDKYKNRRFKEKTSLRGENIASPSEPEADAVNVEEPAECSGSCAPVLNSEENAGVIVEDDSWWMDFIGPTPEPGVAKLEPQTVGECTDDGQVSQNQNILQDNLENQIVDSPKDELEGALKTAIDTCPKEQAGSLDYCGESLISDTISSSCVQDSGVILLPYKELDPAMEEIDGTASSSQNLQVSIQAVASKEEPDMQSSLNVNNEQAEVEFDGFGDMFNEPEVTSEPKTENGPSDDMDIMFWNSSSSELTQDEVDDSSAPVSVDSCLALFTKPELLTDEHAWHCEHCSEVSSSNVLKRRKPAKQSMEIVDDSESLSLQVKGENSSDVEELNNGKISSICKNIDKQVDTLDNSNVDGESESKRCNSQCSIENKSELLKPALSEQPQSSNSQKKEKDIMEIGPEKSTTDETSDSKDNDLCSVGNQQDAGCGEDASEASSSSLKDDMEIRHSSARENESTTVINKIEKKHSKPSNRAHSIQDSRGKGKVSEGRRVMRDAMKRFLIYKAPPILTIHLKRFSQDARGRLTKLRGHVNFQEMLDIRQYMDPRCREKEKSIYRLVGAVQHSGSMGGGHYVAYVRGDKIQGKSHRAVGSPSWFYASDAHVREVSFSEVLKSEAYILFYERLQD